MESVQRVEWTALEQVAYATYGPPYNYGRPALNYDTKSCGLHANPAAYVAIRTAYIQRVLKVQCS